MEIRIRSFCSYDCCIPIHTTSNSRFSWIHIDRHLRQLCDKVLAVLLIVPLIFPANTCQQHLAQAFFLIFAFIGNEADNMWGTFVFALPLVYNGHLWFVPLDAVQVGFLVTPFIYPAVRIIQAVIVMLIAVPLLRILRKTNWLWSEDNLFSQKTTPPPPAAPVAQ